MPSKDLSDFKSFLDKSPTSWHAAEELAKRLASSGFSRLHEEEKWKLQKGKSYFVQRGGSLCAFSLPKKTAKRAVILGSHTDSPALKVKPKPEVQKENMILLGVEVYGSPLLTSWLNRDLALAGRVAVTNKKGKIQEKLVFLDEAPLFIPQLAPHLDRDVNEKGLLLNKQEHLVPIATLISSKGKQKSYLETLLKRQISFDSLLSFDLFLVPIEKSRYLGTEEEMLSSYRLDNLASAHSCASALMDSKESQETLQMAIFSDHEEIGSRSSTGAASPFLEDILKRITYALQMDEEEFFQMKSRSLCVSVDMAHALNPNYVQKYDPNHQPLLGKGIVVKYNADLKYTTSAPTAAQVIRLAEKLKLPYQSFVSRSDIPGGSTIGPILAQSLGIATVDIGCPQLSMHSAREVMACQDFLDMSTLLTHLLGEDY